MAAHATTRSVACSGDISAAVQSAIDASADGDEVSIGAGSCTVSSTVQWANKILDLHGAGVDTTTITATHANSSISITMSNASKGGWKFHDLTWANSPTNSFGLFQIHAELATGIPSGWRMHHLKLIGAGASYIIPIQGLTYGLMDHITFDLTAGNGGVSISAYMTNLDATYTLPDASKLLGTSNMVQPVDWGTDKAVYIEDCAFLSTNAVAIFDSTDGGARIVIRHSTFKGYVYAHWTRTRAIYGTKYEIYNNVADCAGLEFMRLEAGTGVVFNNTASGCAAGIWIDERRGERSETGAPLGVCDGSKAWDGNIESSGWPCLGQVGRGSGTPGRQASEPLYAWNNGTDAGCAAGGACTNSWNISLVGTGGSVSGSLFLKATPHSNGEVDYVNGGTTPKPGYTAYTYPHPLQGGPAPTAASFTGAFTGKR